MSNRPRARAVQTYLMEHYSIALSWTRVTEMMDGNPMIDDDTTVQQAARMIFNHLQDQGYRLS